ncbi:hypothetical protein FSP39_005502 [Pinctada imbricata]|uniref:TauD/TfdA-like domain-containing protein n=1 Tax=Pinctada imbricata TaxID=66713 RepID=A0AA88Y7P1_PINIB|nr:hypothetical protein FSP39_005502 [Pinctada imbricata]
MDLLMYESPPGIQFLHCLEFDPSVEGGETTFTDLYAVAEEFRRTYSEHFIILCRVPLTFERIHATRFVLPFHGYLIFRIKRICIRIFLN